MRIANKAIPREKRVVIALTYVYGIGISTAKKIVEKIGIDINKKVLHLNENEEKLIIKEVSDLIVESQLREIEKNNKKRIKDINCYRGMRHRMGLPCRGQRTKTNARTLKGRGRPIANKKKAGK